MTSAPTKRLMPTGSCWCGCAIEPGIGSFFAPGHDKIAAGKIIREVFGDTPHFIAAFGRAPGDARTVDGALVAVATRAQLALALQRLDELREIIGSTLTSDDDVAAES